MSPATVSSEAACDSAAEEPANSTVAAVIAASTGNCSVLPKLDGEIIRFSSCALHPTPRIRILTRSAQRNSKIGAKNTHREITQPCALSDICSLLNVG